MPIPLNDNVRGIIAAWAAGDRSVTPVLADALEDAGFTDERELRVLRGLEKNKYGHVYQPDLDWYREQADGVPPGLLGFNWREAFAAAGEPAAEYNSAGLTAARPGSDVPLGLFGRKDVVEIRALAEGENDGPNWLCFGRLVDGRWFFVSAGCDYTGWDCQSWASCQVGETASEVWRYAMGDDDRARLGLPAYAPNGPQELP